MNAPKITVTLRPSFLARDVRLVASERDKRWYVAAVDAAGGIHSDVTVNGERPSFTCDDSALAFIRSLALAGVTVDRIFATPALARPSTYIVPAARGAAYDVRVA